MLLPFVFYNTRMRALDFLSTVTVLCSSVYFFGHISN